MGSSSHKPRFHLACDLSLCDEAENPTKYWDRQYLAVKPGQEIGPVEDKYRIIAKLGYGSFSTVWLVRRASMRFARSISLL
jgi:serine/threonine protein kinase